MSFWRDLRYAARSLARTPAFSIITILTLALGIGANTAIFSVVSAVLLKPLPYSKPEQLVYVSTQFKRLGFDQFWVSPPEFFELQERAQSFSSIGAFSSAQINLTAPDRPRRVNFVRVSDGLLQTLGTHAEFGRWFESAETRPNGPDVVVLTHELWRSAFGANPNTLGQVIEVGGVRRTVVGIMPPGFDVADLHVELLLPLVGDPANRQNRGSHFLYLIARLKDGATIATARAELEALLAAWPTTIARPANSTNGPHTPDPQGHRLRQYRESPARPRGVQAQGTRGPRRPRRRRPAAAHAVHDRGDAAVACRRCARSRHRDDRPSRGDCILSRGAASHGGRDPGRPRDDVRVAGRGRVRRGVFTHAAVAHADRRGCGCVEGRRATDDRRRGS